MRYRSPAQILNYYFSKQKRIAYISPGFVSYIPCTRHHQMHQIDNFNAFCMAKISGLLNLALFATNGNDDTVGSVGILK